MANTIAYLEYTFMFNPTDGWAHLAEFERDLSRFFESEGFDAQILRSVEGLHGRRILYLSKKTLVGIPESGYPQSNIEPGKKLKQLQDVKNYKMKVVKK